MSGTCMEVSAAKSAKWSGEEMDESASEEEAKTVGGGGGGRNDADGEGEELEGSGT